MSIDAAAGAALGGPQRRFARFAGALLVYLLLVILFGAWVRITGSGAGCGDHWPTCHGELVPRTPNQQTIIEYTHRLSSGALGLLSLLLPLWAWRAFPAGHAVRWCSVATLALVVMEAAIGAGLVLKQLVASNASQARAVAVALHLGNTLLLTASAALTLGYAHTTPREPRTRRLALGGAGWALALFLIALVLVATTGAVTALGDTLFPVRFGSAGSSGVPRDHFLVQLRVVHPVLACLVVCFAVGIARHFAVAAATRPWARAVGFGAAIQLVLGVLSILLGAPGWLQLGHLLMAQVLWISAVLLSWTWARSRPSLGHSPEFGPSALPWLS